MQRLASLAWACALTLPVAAQPVSQLRTGYQTEVRFDENNSPLSFAGFAVGPDGTLYAGVDDELIAVDPLGNRTVLQTLGAGNGFALLSLQGTDLYYADFFNVLWRRDLTTGVAVAGSAPAFTFDLAALPGGPLLASANPGALSGGNNGIWLIDFQGGQHREVVQLTGPSGPLAFDARGNLLYATQVFTYPTPPRSVDVVRFDAARLRAAIQGGPALTPGDATVVVPGLDGAFDLAFDDRQRLHVSDAANGDIRRTLPGSTSLDPVPLVARPAAPSTVVPLQLQFVDRGAATFDPYQPADGAELFATFSNFATVGEVHRLRSARPSLVSSPTGSAGPGPVQFVLDGLPPNAAVGLCVSAAPAVAERPVLNLAGTPLWWALDLTAPMPCVPLAASAAGAAARTWTHPGGFGGTLQLQALALDPAASPLEPATSGAYALQLLP